MTGLLLKAFLPHSSTLYIASIERALSLLLPREVQPCNDWLTIVPSAYATITLNTHISSQVPPSSAQQCKFNSSSIPPFFSPPSNRPSPTTPMTTPTLPISARPPTIPSKSSSRTSEPTGRTAQRDTLGPWALISGMKASLGHDLYDMSLKRQYWDGNGKGA